LGVSQGTPPTPLPGPPYPPPGTPPTPLPGPPSQGTPLPGTPPDPPKPLPGTPQTPQNPSPGPPQRVSPLPDPVFGSPDPKNGVFDHFWGYPEKTRIGRSAPTFGTPLFWSVGSGFSASWVLQIPPSQGTPRVPPKPPKTPKFGVFQGTPRVPPKPASGDPFSHRPRDISIAKYSENV
jgi:hypothetical protein